MQRKLFIVPERKRNKGRKWGGEMIFCIVCKKEVVAVKVTETIVRCPLCSVILPISLPEMNNFFKSVFEDVNK